MAVKRLAKTGEVDFSKYDIETKLTLPKRAAHLLHWTALNYPGIFLQWNKILQIILGVAKLPSIKSDEVRRLRAKSGAMRSYLWKTYSRGIAHHRLLGIRATVDDNDKLENEGRKAVNRLNSAGQKVIEVTKSINPGDLSTENKAFFTKHLNPLAKAISTVQFAAMLDVPKEDKT